MSPVEKDIVRRKTKIIVDNLKALETVLEMSIDDYKKEIYKRKATERLLQEIVEAAIDINTHLITQTGHEVPDDYYDSFIRMGDIGLLPSDLAIKLAPSAGLRNRIVHEYDALDDSIIFNSVGMAEQLYPLYVKEIEEKINTL